MRRAALAVLTLAGAAASVSVAVAQQRVPFPPRPLPVEAEVQPVLSFSLSQSLEADSNYDLDEDPAGTTYYGETRFAVDYLRDVDTSRLGLGIDTGLRGVDQPEQDFDWIAASPSTAYLDYRTEGVDTLLDASLAARSRIVDTTSTLLIEGDPTDPRVPDTLEQVNLDAREYRYDANLGFTGGTSSPSTWGVRVLATSFDYDKETTDDLAPRVTVNPQANWQLQLTPLISGALFGGYYYYNADDTGNTEIRVAEADAGVIYDPSEVLSLGVGLGYADRKREQDVNDLRETVDHEKGPVFRANMRYTLPEATLVGDVRWTTASAEDNHFSGTLGGFYALPRGMLSGSIYQLATGDSAGNEVRVTGASIGIEHEVNSVSRIGLDFAWATQVSLETEFDTPDITRTDFVVSYAYDITAAVSAEVGYNYRTRDEDPIDADGHRVYLLLGRSFETGL